MEWENLLSTEKLTDEEELEKYFSDYPINEFEKDYNKIVSSASFRRLQDKTQVFPLDKSDFVRTRLTHSIEVSTIARQLGIMVSNNTTEYKPSDITPEIGEQISSVLLCAGLLHDLGNPPFGHFGETVIGDWFKSALKTIKYKDMPLNFWLTEQMINDLENFEGNAQALRILLKSIYNSEINLSFSVIGTLVKYPTNSKSFDKKAKDIRKHKLGYFLAEEEKFYNISENIGTKNENEIYRHPLTFILEAADDIAYATADLEDAFKKDLFTLDDFIKYFKNSLDKAQDSNYKYYSNLLIDNLCSRRQNKKDSIAFKEWLNYVQHWLMYVAVYRFSSNYKSIMEGSYNGDLFKNTNHCLTIKILKEAMIEFAFNTPNILKLELSAQTILSFLLDNFVNAVLYYDCEDKKNNYVQSKADKKYISILSENHKEDYKRAKTDDESYNLYLRLLMVTDYISGMTDSFAKTLYRELSGIE